MKKSALILSAAVLLSSQIFAEEDEWQDDWEDESPLSLTHEVSYGYAGIIKNQSVNHDNAVLNELRWLSQIDYQGESYSINSEVELNADMLIDDYVVDLRQLNIIKPVGSQSDLKVGRQVITWGTGDLLFLNDLFAKDWKSFFNGRDNRYLKPPVDAIRFSHYRQAANFEIALMPEFQPDNTPDGERYSFYIPSSGIIQPNEALQFVQPDEGEFAARLFANKDGIEWAVYAYSGFFKSPSRMINDNGSNYAAMDSLGASLRMSAGGGLFNTEAAYYRSKEDKSGRDPMIQNSQIRFLLGFEKELKSELTLALQAYVEKTLDYSALINNLPEGQTAADEHRTMLTARLTLLALQQNLVNSLMVFYSPSDEDYYLRYSSKYTLSDRWKFIAGLNLLGGEQRQTFLAQMQDNNNLFVRLQYNFN